MRPFLISFLFFLDTIAGYMQRMYLHHVKSTQGVHFQKKKIHKEADKVVSVPRSLRFLYFIRQKTMDAIKSLLALITIDSCAHPKPKLLGSKR